MATITCAVFCENIIRMPSALFSRIRMVMYLFAFKFWKFWSLARFPAYWALVPECGSHVGSESEHVVTNSQTDGYTDCLLRYRQHFLAGLVVGYSACFEQYAHLPVRADG